MALKDILNKVSDGGYASLSVSEFNELKKYPEYKEIFNKISDGGYSSLSVAEFNGLKKLSATSAPQSSPKLTPDQYRLLQQNVGNYGYSGLDDVQKKQFQEQFPMSKFAKAGGSFKDAVKYVDSQSAYNKKGKPNEGMKTSEMGDNTTLSGALKNTWMGIKDIGTLAKEHPGTAAFTIASGMFPEMLPLTGGGIVRAGLVGSAATAIDKYHPFTSELPDYETETPVESATDVLGSGANSALTHGLFTGLNRTLGAKYYGALAKNVEAEKVAAEKNAEIAAENARRAEFNSKVNYESMQDPESVMNFYRTEMMKQNPGVATTFRPKFTDDLAGLGAELDYTREGRMYIAAKKLEELKAMMAAKGKVIRIPESKLTPPSKLQQGVVEPSDWDVAKFKNEYETVLPDVTPEYVEVPTVNLMSGLPNSIRVAESKLSNLLRGSTAGEPDWFSWRNNTLLYPALKPIASGLAKGLDPFASYIVPEGIGLLKNTKKSADGIVDDARNLNELRKKFSR